MGVPSVTARILPTGIAMPNGFSSKIALSNKPGIDLWERSITGGGVEGGDIDITTMFNVAWMTARFKTLVKGKPFKAECGYDPDQLAAIYGEVNVEQTGGITEHYPNGATVSWFGGITDFERGSLKIGEYPLATVTFTPTNYDSVANVEAGPHIVPSGSGT